jgi:hypothetical protein
LLEHPFDYAACFRSQNFQKYFAPDSKRLVINIRISFTIAPRFPHATLQPGSRAGSHLFGGPFPFLEQHDTTQHPPRR